MIILFFVCVREGFPVNFCKTFRKIQNRINHIVVRKLRNEIYELLSNVEWLPIYLKHFVLAECYALAHKK